MRSLTRLCFAVLTALVMSVCFSATHTALAQTNGTSGIIISEFRFDGPNGTSDEFVEIVNNTSSPKTIISSDANNLKGFSVLGLVGGNAIKICTIPFNTLLIPGQHFLCAKTPGFELGGYSGAADDNIANYTALGLQVDGGVALFSSEDVVVNSNGTFFSPTGTAFREDAVGFKKLNSATNDNVFAPVFREGAGLNPIGPQDPASRSGQTPNDLREYSFVRKHGISGGQWSGPTYNDSNNNAVDFALVANMGDQTFFGQADFDVFSFAQAGSTFDPSPAGFPGSEAATTAVFGAPGPQSRTSPVERNFLTQFIRSLFDTGSAANVSPNIERNSGIVCGGSRGDLILRFTYRNNTTLNQSNLRVRWVDISTINRNNGAATSVLDLLDATAATRKLFVNNGRDVTTAATGNDPSSAPGDGSGGNPAGDGIVNQKAAGGAGIKTVRGTYVEGVDKTPQVLGYSSNFLGFTPQNFRQVNPSYKDLELNPGTPCRVGGFNSATVATPPVGPNVNNQGVTTTALPAVLRGDVPPGGSISLEHRFGVIRSGQFLIVGIIESN